MTTYRRSEDVLETSVGGQIVLLQSRTWKYMDFDTTGSAIWKMLETPRTLDSLVSELRTRYRVDESRCRQDTQAFLDKLAGEEFLVATA